jgi:uncharacterized protein YutE (UPF0331/DUF86 family)
MARRYANDVDVRNKKRIDRKLSRILAQINRLNDAEYLDLTGEEKRVLRVVREQIESVIEYPEAKP